jgi:hypothetical protein
MTDNRNKKILWGLASLIGIILFLPSAFFIKALGDYHDFFSGINPRVLKQTRDSMIPEDLHKDLSFKSKLSFAEFRIKAPRATAVFLIGNFNNWNAGALKMMKGSDGIWSVFLPLPKGRYRYLYIIDDKTILDPANPASELRAGHPVSIKEVR